jgi:hypothetical protein
LTPEPRPVSDAQLAANGPNSLKSSGPTTEAGLAISSQNRTIHGLARQNGAFLLLTTEDPANFAALKTALEAEHQPMTETESILVNNMAESAAACSDQDFICACNAGYRSVLYTRIPARNLDRGILNINRGDCRKVTHQASIFRSLTGATLLGTVLDAALMIVLTAVEQVLIEPMQKRTSAERPCSSLSSSVVCYWAKSRGQSRPDQHPLDWCN